MILLVLAVVGGAGLAYRLARSLLRAVIATAEATASDGLAEISARRGDLTLLAERQERRDEARRARRRDALLALLWLLLLLVPNYLGWTLYAYAASSVTWLLPRAPRATEPPAPGRSD